VRILLDEQLPVDLAEVLSGHTVDTVVSRGWAGIKNGDLLQRMRGEYDALLTMDRGIEFQQNLSGLPFGVLLLRAPSTRLAHLRPLVLTILDVLSRLSPGQLHRIGS
jgi:predicted nuclease of predicted toxin-antitoxin system